jgi:hypothetical protein
MMIKAAFVPAAEIARIAHKHQVSEGFVRTVLERARDLPCARCGIALKDHDADHDFEGIE